MVTIYDHFIPGCIKNCEAFFDSNISIEMLDGECQKFMGKIDKSRIVDYRTRRIETPYGLTEYTNMSTGLKTLIIVYLMKKGTLNKVPISVDECGTNVLKEIFKLVDNEGISLILQRAVYIADDIDVNLNGTTKCSLDEFGGHIKRRR